MVGISLVGCAETPSQLAVARATVTAVVKGTDGVPRATTVGAMVVESNGFVYVDAVIPTVAPTSIRFQIEQPVIVYNQTATRGVGTRLIADTAGLTFRVKSFVNAVPSEIAVLNASSSDIIAVFRTTPIMANGVVHTN